MGNCNLPLLNFMREWNEKQRLDKVNKKDTKREIWHISHIKTVAAKKSPLGPQRMSLKPAAIHQG